MKCCVSSSMVGMVLKAGVCFFSGINCIIKACKVSKMNCLPAASDLRRPFICILGPKYASMTTCVRFAFFHIPKILLLADTSKVTNSVVCFVAVDVVNMLIRPLAIIQRPNDAMRQKSFAEDRASKVSMGVDAVECFLACKLSVENSPLSVSWLNSFTFLFVKKLSRVWAKIDISSEQIYANVCGNHVLAYLLRQSGKYTGINLKASET